MKLTSISALLAISLPLVSVAETSSKYWGQIDYNYYSGVGVSNGASSNGLALSGGGSAIPNKLDLDGRVELNSLTPSDSNSDWTAFLGTGDQNMTSLELGLTPKTLLTSSMGVYSRLAFGYEFNSTYGDSSYMTIEPGLFWSPNSSSTIRAGYKHGTTLGTEKDQGVQYNAAVLSGEYAFNKRDSVVGQYVYANGQDIGYNQYQLGYLAHF